MHGSMVILVHLGGIPLHASGIATAFTSPAHKSISEILRAGLGEVLSGQLLEVTLSSLHQ